MIGTICSGENEWIMQKNSNRSSVIDMSHNFKDYDTFHRNYKNDFNRTATNNSYI